MEHIDLSFDLQAMPPRSSLGFMAQLNARRFVGDCAPTDIYDFICLRESMGESNTKKQNLNLLNFFLEQVRQTATFNARWIQGLGTSRTRRQCYTPAASHAKILDKWVPLLRAGPVPSSGLPRRQLLEVPVNLARSSSRPGSSFCQISRVTRSL